ncbi:MAG TPA: hypothetical protein VGL72_14250 [Bryobacteraceae bacterium]|jgi:hypothetical protein
MADLIAAGPVPVDRPTVAGLVSVDRPTVEGLAVADHLPTAAAGLQAAAGLAVEVPTVVAADRRTAAVSITNRSLFIG